MPEASCTQTMPWVASSSPRSRESPFLPKSKAFGEATVTIKKAAPSPGNQTPSLPTNPAMFATLEEAIDLLPKDIGWISWGRIKEMPAPEVPENLNTGELGDLGLTGEEEAAIVAFLKVLSDGYTP
jgi:hypothetical protein